MEETEETKSNYLVAQVALLTARLVELEDRVTQLESRGGSTSGRVASASLTAPTSGEVAPAVSQEELLAAIAEALTEMGEGDAGAIRQHIAKKGWAIITRSDVNKALYANQTRFQLARQDGAKPIWKNF